MFFFLYTYVHIGECMVIFLCMGGCIPAWHAYVLVLAPVLVLKFWRMVVGIRLLAYRCMTVSLRMQVGW